MNEKSELLIHFVVTLIKLLKPGGVKRVMAESLAMRQQLIVAKRGQRRAPKLTTYDRFFFGALAFFVDSCRLQKVAVIIKPATVLKFHRILVKRKYHRLYSSKSKKMPGPKGPDPSLIDMVLELKKRNPKFGYGRISMQIHESFGIEISPFSVGRILRKHYHDFPTGDGPSWLTFIGHSTDSLWSVDFFRCESIGLKSHWIMLVIDQFSRRIVGFAVHAGDLNGTAACRMFNTILSGNVPPQYLCSDGDA